MNLSRRSLIAARAGQAASQTFFARTGLPIGLQLYTLADQARTPLSVTA